LHIEFRIGNERNKNKTLHTFKKMSALDNSTDRRRFLKTSAKLTGVIAASTLFPIHGLARTSMIKSQEGLNIIGPKEGFSPQIGTLYAMMTWMREGILSPLKGMTIGQLDYLHDPESNSIGAMLYHLAATEKYYSLHTFDGLKWGSWDEKTKQEWDIPMALGENARKTIKGHSLDFYLDILHKTRANTIEEFRKRDDQWLLTVDQDWAWGPTNNYCKWFHVCEHESNHNGQIKYIKKRIPGLKEGKE
jgi:hypothetical protein